MLTGLGAICKEDVQMRQFRASHPPVGEPRRSHGIRCRAVSAFLIPIIVLGSLLFLMALLAVLGRVRGGRYLRPLVMWMTKVPLLRKGIKKASMHQLERENPELARAVKKIEAFGTPKTPEQAQRALALLSPSERRAYLAAAGDPADIPDPHNRPHPPPIGTGVQPGVTPTPRPVGRKKRR